jgi:hypothetical protein
MALISPRSGLAHSTDSTAALTAIDTLEQELLFYGLDAAVVFRAAEADPDFAGAQALSAAMHLFAMAPAGAIAARPYLARAAALAPGADPREQLLIEAIAAWSRGDTAGALDLHLDIAGRWPRDLVSARIAQFHQLNGGDFAGMRRLTAQLVAANPDVPQVMGMHAFALEQTGDSAGAERLGRIAADAAFDPWAEHAVAHALERQGRAREGLDFMAARSGGWARCSSFLYTHNWWHVALFHLELGERDQALALFDGRVWGVRKGSCQDQANAVSLLARVELRGVPVGGRWEELAEWLKPRTAEHVNGLLDLHYAYGLARAGADAEVAALQQSLSAQARKRRDPVWRELVPAAVAGVVAHARGRLAEAAARLGAVLPRLHLVGGSSTQRNLFTLLHRDALARG